MTALFLTFTALWICFVSAALEIGREWRVK